MKIQTREFSKYCMLLQNIPNSILPPGTDIVDIATLFGVIFTIIISFVSLTLQRQGAAREAIEQLDSLDIRAFKIKPILHRYRILPFKRTDVKLQFYNPNNQVSDLSAIYPNFLAYPGYIFKNYSVKAVKDGYILSIKSKDSVQIRRETNNLLTDIFSGSNGGQICANVEFEIFQSDYIEALDNNHAKVHKAIINSLEDNGGQTFEDLRETVRNEHDLHPQLAELAVEDLVAWGEIEKDDSDEYWLIEKQNSSNDTGFFS